LLVSFTDQTRSNEIELLAAHVEAWAANQGVSA